MVGTVEKTRLVNVRAAAPLPVTVSWVAVATKLCRVTLSNVTGLSPVMAKGALVSVSPVTWVPPAAVNSRLPPVIAGGVAAGVEMNSPFTTTGVVSEKPGVWAEMSRMLKCEPVPGVAKSSARVAAVASTTLCVPEGA